MEHIVYFILAFIISAFGRFYLYKKSKKEPKKTKKKTNAKENLAIEMKYLIAKFGLSKEKVDCLKIAKIVSLLDAFIIAIVCTFVTFVTEDMILIFLLGIVLIFTFIYGSYEILGRILKKKGYDKNGL